MTRKFGMAYNYVDCNVAAYVVAGCFVSMLSVIPLIT